MRRWPTARPVPRVALSILEKLRTNSARRLEQLIDALLVLARSQRGLERRDVIDLSTAVAAAVEGAGPEATERGIEIRSGSRPGVGRG